MILKGSRDKNMLNKNALNLHEDFSKECSERHSTKAFVVHN